MDNLKLVIPKGRLFANVVELLNKAGLGIDNDQNSYRPNTRDKSFDVKLMKPQNIPELIEIGYHDIGFTGLDWINEKGSTVEVLMNCGFNPVTLVSAISNSIAPKALYNKKITVATEYPSIADVYLQSKGYSYRIIHTYGATEVFPPEDADMIIDNISSGKTLKSNNLKILDTLMESSTCFIANKKSLMDEKLKKRIESLMLLFNSILTARNWVMLEMNVTKHILNDIVSHLPSMKAPTISTLTDNEGYAIKTAVLINEVNQLIPKLKEFGATDIIEYECNKVLL